MAERGRFRRGSLPRLVYAPLTIPFYVLVGYYFVRLQLPALLRRRLGRG